MSKSPSIFLPALGVTGIVMGAAYGISMRAYGSDKIAALETRVEQQEAGASAAAMKADEAARLAEAEATRAAELEAEVARIQAEARAQVASLTAPAPSGLTYGLGRAAHAEEIAAWDVDVLPDGRGLPEGSGDVWTGEEVFVAKCASCHGDFAEGVDNWPVLAGGFDTLDEKDPVKTVGSYWPYLSTAWDYIHRSMPFGEAGTLSADETYAIVAYILYSNDKVDDDFVLTHENLADFDMHNAEGFVVDDRPELEYAAWRAEPCMENCKEEARVTMRSVFMVETPPEGGSNSVMNPARNEELPAFTATGAAFIPEAKAPVAPATTEAPVQQASADAGADLIEAGEKVFKKCKSCHAVGAGAKNKSGPHLNGLLGRMMGSVEGFGYSSVFKAAMEDGRIWDEEALSAFLAKPKSYMKGTKMAFAGLKKETDIAAVTAYLKSVGE